MSNFPFEHDGETFWYSRSIVSSGYVYCKYEGQWYVLTAQRGTGSTQTGRWNVPGGFLDHNESTKCAAQREVWEETGVLIPANRFQLVNIDSIPQGKHQHVRFSYVCNLGKVRRLPEVSNINNELNETMWIMWMEVGKVNRRAWISKQDLNIQKFFKIYIRPNLWQRIKNWMSNKIEQEYC